MRSATRRSQRPEGRGVRHPRPSRRSGAPPAARAAAGRSSRRRRRAAGRPRPRPSATASPVIPGTARGWEGFALEQVLLAHGGREAYYYATQRGAELDLLLRRGGRHWGFEFKAERDAPGNQVDARRASGSRPGAPLGRVPGSPRVCHARPGSRRCPWPGSMNSISIRAPPGGSRPHRAQPFERAAGVLRCVLYVDGPSDLDLLRALAERLGHPASHAWDDQANAFYLRDLRRLPGAAQADPGTEPGRGPRSVWRQVRTDPRAAFPRSSPRRPHPERPRYPRHGDKGLAKRSREDGLPTVWWHREEVERQLLKSEVLGMYAATRYFNRPVIDRIEDELLDVTYSVHPDGGRFLDDPERVERSPSEFVTEFFQRLADRIGDESLLPRGDLHRLVRSMDKRDIPSEVSRVLDLLDTLFRDTRGDQKCPVTRPTRGDQARERPPCLRRDGGLGRRPLQDHGTGTGRHREKRSGRANEGPHRQSTPAAVGRRRGPAHGR